VTADVRRPTRAQRAVMAALDGEQRFRSAQEIFAVLRAGGDPTGLTSVYRALQALTADGVVDSRRTPSGETVYRRCDETDHHHHLVCGDCGTTVEIAEPALERVLAKLATKHGFAPDGHLIEMTGRCAACATRR
jgi:Fur family ferric uptake transcriptional regulator